MTITKKDVYIFTTISLALAIPAPARFAVGIILVLELNILMMTSVCFRALVSKLNIEQFTDVILVCFIVFMATFYKQILVFISPETVIQLGFVIYIPAVSSFFTVYIIGTEMKTLREDLKSYMKHTLIYSVFSLLFFLLRELVGFGTFTYVTFSGIKEVILFDATEISAFSFIATIQGALTCLALIVVFCLFAINKLRITERSVEYNGIESEVKK